jgi:predicted nucleic acid-binding protein
VSKTFIDTNILVYLLDNRIKHKQELCRSLVKAISSSNEAVISTQVLQEFYVASTTKLRVDPVLVKGIIHTFSNMEIITIDNDLVNEAIDINIQNKIAFWDSLIIAAAESAKCSQLLSEDLNNNQCIREVTIVNPFK